MRERLYCHVERASTISLRVAGDVQDCESVSCQCLTTGPDSIATGPNLYQNGPGCLSSVS